MCEATYWKGETAFPTTYSENIHEGRSCQGGSHPLGLKPTDLVEMCRSISMANTFLVLLFVLLVKTYEDDIFFFDVSVHFYFKKLVY